MNTHAYVFRPLYADTDMMGVVYYGNYLRFFEAARGEMLRDRGLSYKAFEEMGYALPVVKAEVNYRHPALYDEELLIESTLDKLGRSSLGIRYRILRKADQKEIAIGTTVHACVDHQGRVLPLPDGIRSLFAAEAAELEAAAQKPVELDAAKATPGAPL